MIGFSDLQAAIAQDLIKAGVNVIVFNQRSVEEIFETILMLARIVAAEAAGLRLADRLRGELAQIAESAAKVPATAARLLRGVVGPADQRHSLGR